MPDSEIIQYLVEKEERKKAERAALFSETEVQNARATWYKMKLHQFFYKYNITKAEWQRMIIPENRDIFNETHQKYVNSKREYFIMPLQTWVDLANQNIGSEEFKSFNKKNRILIRFCRGQRLNYTARKINKTLQKPKTRVTRLDVFDAYNDEMIKDYEDLEEETPSFCEERTKRLRAKKNLTDEEEVYLALGGPLPYDPNFWPDSFLQSDEVINELEKEHLEQVRLENMETRERRKIINLKIKEENKKELAFYEKNKSLIRKGKLPVTPQDIWHGYTGIRKKIWEHYVKEEEEREKAILARWKPKQVQEYNEKKIEIDLERILNETKSTLKKVTTEKIKITTDRYGTKHFRDISREYRPLRKRERKPVVGKFKPTKYGKSRRDRAKERDREKYGSEYSKIVREKYRRKSDRSYSRSNERGYRRRYDSRDGSKYDQRGGRRKDASYERRKHVDSRDRRRRSSRSDEKGVKRKKKRMNRGRPERFKKQKPQDKKKKKRNKRDIPSVRSTTIEPMFYESRSEYRGKMVIDDAWLTRRRTYLAEKYARLSREEKERILRKQGKLKEGQTITSKKPTTEPVIDKRVPYHKQLEIQLMLQGFTKRANFTGDIPSLDEYHYEKAERDYMRKRKQKYRKKQCIDSEEKSVSGTEATLHPDEISDDILDVRKYEKEERKYIEDKKRQNVSSESYSYYSNVDKNYVTDHNPDYGSEERMRKIEENMIIDYKNKEVQFKNSPRIKYSKEDPKATIPTWPTKWKNRGVRPQDRRKCFFNPSTTDQYRQVLYIYHKYNQMKEAWDRKENIDDIPSLDSDY